MCRRAVPGGGARGIPLASFAVDDLHAEYDRLVAAGTTFTPPPTSMGRVMTAVFDDTCGNLIQLALDVTPSNLPRSPNPGW
jgi:predicted enzyme related to lactoylglutathione lyase